MPCESCHVQFTVFRRKRSCADCKRFYCSNCLSTTKRRTASNVHISSGVQLCKRCVIFAKRPLLRTDLLQLKPKDLIFYLQSKHISTTGCVEKDELVGLVLTHVHQVDATADKSDNGGARSPTDPSANSFDSLKQTCQNFFTSITENISDSLNSFDSKSSAKVGEETRGDSRSGRGSTDSATIHISDQPTVSTREIPTYASFQQQTHNNCNNYQSTTTTNRPSTTPLTTTTSVTAASPTLVSSSTSSVTTKGSSQTSASPEISISSLDRAEGVENPLATSLNSQRIGITRQEAGEENSDCECSDDELLATFSGRSLARKNDVEVTNKDTLKPVEPDERIGNKSRASTDINCAEMSSQSSFEELGAIGGISDESKAATDTNSSNMDQWQILDNATLQALGSPVGEQSLTVACIPTAPASNNNMISVDTAEDSSKDLQVAVPFLRQEQAPPQSPTPQRAKKITRRRSDSYLNRQRQRPTSEDDSPTGNSARKALITLHEQVVESADDAGETDLREKHTTSRGVGSCHRCGKHKASLRKQVEKMRRHLESAQLSEPEIKKELQDFLSYLEQRTKSMDYSDTETVGSSLSGRNVTQSPEHQQSQSQQQHVWEDASMPHWEYQLDNNEGIHVYAGSTTEMSDYKRQSSRFINLDDFETIKDLEALSVKQLKEVLMLNRVDYKGCCEKQELLDRVQRLWKNLKSAPGVDKLPTDELCKICMDAPIECVILECGHMATCTSCGKVLSECPICRQYIVRVVRFFRA
ncbi:serine-rich adhesin for platelets [Anastrepha obliqua]|uniref:serine-rich adhesin for platelets n=1 Tax=Anastrepha obliqua TaxID=95512 RepID=UPI00240A2A40|nr:serine-rich adhesin for platelets [Anastrepha obliqua]XP_054738709.1 serine-rich adhesin for platelets [Anastrepha obliqua]